MFSFDNSPVIDESENEADVSDNEFTLEEDTNDEDHTPEKEERIQILKENLYTAILQKNKKEFEKAFRQLDILCNLAEEVDLNNLFQEAIQEQCYDIVDFLLADAIRNGIAADLSMDIVQLIRQDNFKQLTKICNDNKIKLSFLDKTDATDDSILIKILEKNTQYHGYTFKDFLITDCFDIHENVFLLFLVREGYLDFLKILLTKGIKLTEEIYRESTREIQSFLDYKPGRNQPTIFEWCSKRIRDSQQIERMMLDFLDTTTEESSADEEVAEEVFIPQRSSQLFLARGAHFCPSIFNQRQRQQLYQSPFKSRTVASMATLNAADCKPEEEVDEKAVNFQQAHQKIKKYFNTLKTSNDRQEPNKKSRNAKKFDSLMDRFIQAYVMDYKYLINHGNIVSQFGAESSHNPIVSTSKGLARAAHYASGLRADEKKFSQHRLDPHYRRSTGKPKHPHLGFVDIFAGDENFLQQNGHDIKKLIAEKKINISHMYQFEVEVSIESMIPAKFNCGRLFFNLPRFDTHWTKEIEEKYGITKSLFTRYQNQLKRIGSKYSGDYVELVNKISQYVIQAQEKQIDEIRQAFSKRESCARSEK